MTSITLYHADWCGHCQRFKPTWEKVKSLIDENNIKYPSNQIKYEEYEATKDDDIVRKKNIDGFPTIMTRINGMESEYKGGKDADVIMKTLRNSMTQSGGAMNMQTGGARRIQYGGSKNMNDRFYHKYLKYKQKYMSLKYKN